LDATDQMTVSIVVPAYKEAENLPQLMEEIASAMAPTGWTWEVIVVDDNSRDGTPTVLKTIALKYPQFQYMIRRHERGLSSAVLAGFGRACGTVLVVMDADLSHPPVAIADMVRPLLNDKADFMVGSRYVSGGGTQDDWGIFRKLNSAVATALGRPFAGKVRDPMAGFVALRRETYLAADELNPIGYKIGLELMVKCRVKRVMETPIFFRNRLHGKSKLTLQEQLRYLEHLSRLYDYKFRRGSPHVKFLIAALSSTGVGYWVAMAIRAAGAHRLDSVAVGLLAMLLVVGLFFGRYVGTQRRKIANSHPWEAFLIICGAEFLLGIWWAWFFAQRWLFSDLMLACLGICVLARYLLRKLMGQDVGGLHRSLSE